MSQNHSHCHFRYAFELLLNEHAHVSVPRSGRSDYMRGVIPPQEDTPVANMCFHIHPCNRDPSLYNAVRSLIASTRGYTRVLLRSSREAGRHGQNEASLRACTHLPSSTSASSTTKVNTYGSSNERGPVSRPSSRAPSPTPSAFSHFTSCGTIDTE